MALNPRLACSVEAGIWTTERTANSWWKHELETTEARDRNWLLVMESGPGLWVYRPPVSVASFPGSRSRNHATSWAISVAVPIGHSDSCTIGGVSGPRTGFLGSRSDLWSWLLLLPFSPVCYDPCTMVRIL